MPGPICALTVRFRLASWFRSSVKLHRYIIMRSQVVIVPFALIVRMCNGSREIRKC